MINEANLAALGDVLATWANSSKDEVTIYRTEPNDCDQSVRINRALQQKCADWGVYWRAADAHGVDLTFPQAIELLGDALGVEVDIAPVEPAHSWTCDRGCGICEVKTIDFETSREETLDGVLINRKTEPVAVSACCGAGLTLWDNQRDTNVSISK